MSVATLQLEEDIMAVEHIYICNLCRNKDSLVGIRWQSMVDNHTGKHRDTLTINPEGMHQSNTHLCHACIADIKNLS